MENIRKIEQWAADRNLIHGSTPLAQFAKFISEAGELGDALLKKDHAGILDGIGDAVVALTIIAAQCGFTLDQCIAAAYDEIKDRKGIMFNGSFIKENDERYPDVLRQLDNLCVIGA